MTTLTINIPDKEKKLVTELVKKLGGEVIHVDRKKALSKLECGLAEVKAIREGKTKGLTLEDILEK
jgi:hypothetical protein